MKKSLWTIKMPVLAIAALILLPGRLTAQIEKLPADSPVSRIANARIRLAPEVESWRSRAADAKELRERVLAGRIIADLTENGLDASGGILHYAVPAVSNLMRLPEQYPVDGVPGGEVRLIAAKDEYEPASFVLFPFRDRTLTFAVADLKTKSGAVLSASNLDLKVVKVWLQNGNAWYSYFADPGLVPVPELLLKDETLIRTDFDSKANFAKVIRNGRVEYLWISPERQLDSSFAEHGWLTFSSFRYMREQFADAKELQPVSFLTGKFKQMWLTAHIPADQPEGLYRGSIAIRDEKGKSVGSIPLAVRVLPFVLPEPLAPDLKRDFPVTLYGGPSVERFMQLNGGDRELALKQDRAILANMLAHNLRNPMLEGLDPDHIALMKELGFPMKTLIGSQWRFPWAKTPDGKDFRKDMYDAAEQDAAQKAEFIRKHVGPDAKLIVMGGDEPGAKDIRLLGRAYRPYHEHGLGIFCAGHDGIYNKGGYLYDLMPLAEPPESPKSTKMPPLLGCYSGFYAVQHNGSENPDFVRRQHGLAGYKNGHSCIVNYEFAFGPWNDLAYDLYKPMILAYPTREGLVDTLEWEGFREAVDDIRYATLFLTEAFRCRDAAAVSTRYAGKQAIMWWSDLDMTQADLNAVRTEMIAYILKLSVLR